MTPKEIDILLEHGDICKPGHPANLFSDYFFRIDGAIGKEEYFISNKVLGILKGLFEWYLDGILNGNGLNDGLSGSDYKNEIEHRLKYYSPEEVHQKKFLGKLIADNYDKLMELCLKIDPIFGGQSDYPERLRDVWIFDIMEECPGLLRTLKFDILKGKGFDAFGLPVQIDLPNFYLLDHYFLTDGLQKVYDAIAVKRNIEYLQKRISDIDKYSKNDIGKSSKGRKSKPQPGSFEDIFYNPDDAKYALISLRQITPRVIDEENNFTGKNKGIFPMWVDILRNYKSGGIIKTDVSNDAIAQAINSKIKGLNIDGSIFSKTYKRLNRKEIEQDIKSILSEFSLVGKS